MGDILNLVVQEWSRVAELLASVEFFDWRSEFLGCSTADDLYHEMDRARVSVSGWGRAGV